MPPRARATRPTAVEDDEDDFGPDSDSSSSDDQEAVGPPAASLTTVGGDAGQVGLLKEPARMSPAGLAHGTIDGITSTGIDRGSAPVDIILIVAIVVAACALGLAVHPLFFLLLLAVLIVLFL